MIVREQLIINNKKADGVSDEALSAFLICRVSAKPILFDFALNMNYLKQYIIITFMKLTVVQSAKPITSQRFITIGEL